MDGVKITQADIDVQWKKVLDTQGIVTESTRSGGQQQQEAIRETSETVKQLQQAWDSANQALSQGIADVILEGKDLGEVFSNVAKGIARDVIDIIVGGALKQLKAAILENIDLFGKMGKTAADAAAQAAKAGVSVPGASGGSTPSGGGGTLPGGGGLMDTITGVSSAVTAVSSVVSNFQFAAMNKSLDIIVKHTLGAVNQLVSIQETLNTYLPQLNHMVDLWRELQNLEAIVAGLSVGSGGGSGNGSGSSSNLDINELLKMINNSVESQLISLSNATGTSGGGFVAPGTPPSIGYAVEDTGVATSVFVDSVHEMSQAALESAKKLQGALPPAIEKIAQQADELKVSDPASFMRGVDASGGMQGIMDRQAAMQGAMQSTLSSISDSLNSSAGFSSSSTPIYTGSGSSQGYAPVTAAVTVNALDPSGRRIANATVKGLEEKGIRIL
jgi:hypothetical protein